MNRVLCIAALSALVLAPRVVSAGELEQLVDKADRAYRGKTSAGILTMRVHTSSYDRTYKIVVWDDSGEADRALVKILGPALWRGYGTLKVGSKLKLYNPNTNHVTVVGQTMLGDSWMGSHFSNDDLVKETRLAKDYSAKLISKRKGTSALGTATFYRVRLTPRPTAPVAWNRVEFEIFSAGGQVIPVKAEYFRRAKQQKPSRVMTFSDIGVLGKQKLPRTMKMTVASKPGEYTTITYDKLALGVSIPGSKFTESSLRK